jgi:hypothetical protein
MQERFWKIQICSEKIKWCGKANFGKIKYEINTNLPLARAHHFKSDGQDISLACLTLMGHPVQEKRSRMAVRPSPSTPFCFAGTLLVWMVVAAFEQASGFVAF